MLIFVRNIGFFLIGVRDQILIINAHNSIFSKATGYDRVGGLKAVKISTGFLYCITYAIFFKFPNRE